MKLPPKPSAPEILLILIFGSAITYILFYLLFGALQQGAY